MFVVDVGTSTLKAGIVNDRGVAVWLHRTRMLQRENELEEWNAQIWEDALADTLRRAPVEPIHAISISGNGPTLVPLDPDGRPTAPVLLWIDDRGERIPGATSFYLPKVNWFALNHPEAFERTSSFVSCPEYLSYLLTGEKVTVCPNKEFEPFIWDEPQIGRYGLRADQFPAFVQPGTRIGTVSSRAASRFGLEAGTPVFAAGSDFMMSLLGTGTVEPGMICDRAGTSEGINYCSRRPIADNRLRTLPHAVSGYYNVAGILASTGRMFEWFRRFSGQSGVDYEDMIRSIADAFRDLELPYFFPSIHSGERYEFVSALFAGLRPSHGAAQMGVAVLESIGFTIRQVLESMESAGLPVGTLRACGGQAKNLAWTQIKADMIGKRIEVPRIADAELLGCALQGFVGLGAYSSVQDAVSELVHIEYSFEPNPSATARHAERYAKYQALYSKVLHLSDFSD